MIAAFWGVHQAILQEHLDISEQLAASFIYLDDGVRKFLWNTGTLLQGPYFVWQSSLVTSCHYSPACVGSKQVDNINMVNEPTGNDKL